jgi:hypothetical protein
MEKHCFCANTCFVLLQWNQPSLMTSRSEPPILDEGLDACNDFRVLRGFKAQCGIALRSTKVAIFSQEVSLNLKTEPLNTCSLEWIALLMIYFHLLAFNILKKVVFFKKKASVSFMSPHQTAPLYLFSRLGWSITKQNKTKQSKKWSRIYICWNYLLPFDWTFSF